MVFVEVLQEVSIMNPLWNVYKSKVMRTFTPDMEENPVEEISAAAADATPAPHEDGPGSVAQLAKRMQGAGVKGWRSVSGIFSRDDEHQLLEAENQPADHPLAAQPDETPRPSKRSTAFWDHFATKWQQGAAMRRAEAADAAGTEGGAGSQEAGNETGGRREDQESDAGGGGALGEGREDTPTFRWNFVTSKLAELKTKATN